jgi:Ca2+-binding EF-hand superfamily protein
MMQCDAEEFETGLKKLGYKTSNKKLDHIMKELDVDSDGNVEFTEV